MENPCKLQKQLFTIGETTYLKKIGAGSFGTCFIATNDMQDSEYFEYSNKLIEAQKMYDKQLVFGNPRIDRINYWKE